MRILDLVLTDILTSGIFSMFLCLPQWDIRIPQTFKIVAPFLQFNISTMCYKIMKQKVSERPIIRVHTSLFSLYHIYNSVVGNMHDMYDVETSYPL